MEYCGNCGEAVEGRFCRMCGSPSGGAESEAEALPGYGRGYGVGALATAAAPAAAPAGAEPTQYLGAVQPTQPVHGVPGGAQAGGEPTQALSPAPPGSDFDSLFRPEDGANSPHDQTQMLPPVEGGYPAQPSGGAQQPPGRRGYEDTDEDERANRKVILVVVGAAVVASAIIIGLLAMGGQNSVGSPSAGATPTTGTGPSAADTSTSNVITLPTDGATMPASPTARPSSAGASSPAAFSGNSFPLGPGSAGSWVKYVQQRLQQLGYYNGSPSGTFDQATAQAVQQFQAAAHVTGDPASTVGQSTLVALVSAGGTPNLHLGSRSTDVGRLNSALNYATGSHLSGDRYTMSTTEAVAKYQSSVGLAPSGQVGGGTWAKLQSGTLN